jgi:predicted enzyme related to lactoylglutathione lyase
VEGPLTTEPEEHIMTAGVRTVIYPVDDLARAKQFFTVLTGAEPVADAPYYVQFDVAGQAVGLDPHGHRYGQAGPVAYWHVDDVPKSLAELVEAGAEVVQEPTDVGGGMKIAVAKDADGNLIGLRPGA